VIGRLMADREKAKRVMAAVLKMVKLDIAAMQKGAEGQAA